jgi:SAM-dependent methyltransferase
MAIHRGDQLPLRELYRRRFSGADGQRTAIWGVLCRHYFQKLIRDEATVVELAAGGCEFINNIEAARRIAVDLNEDVRLSAAAGVEALVGSATDLAAIAAATVDVVFVSNFFEHIERPDILQVLSETKRILKPGGTLIVLQPNIRFVGADYWMFFDHITPLDDRSLVEAIEIAGLTVDTVIPRFLPYTTRSRLPEWPVLVRLYLMIPLLGKQSLITARR